MTYELDLFITDEKIKESTDLIDCVVKEINNEMSEFLVEKSFEYNNHIVSFTDNKNVIKIPVYSRENDVKNALNGIENTFNKYTNKTDIFIRCVYIDDEKMKIITSNPIDYQSNLHLHFIPSIKMSHYRDVLTSSPLKDIYKYERIPSLSFYVSDDVEKLIKSRFGTTDGIYAFILKMNDVISNEIACDLKYYLEHTIPVYDDREQVLVQTENDLKKFYIYYTDYDEELRMNDFFINEKGSDKKYMMMYNFLDDEIYLLHQRMEEVQTFEYVNDCSDSLELNELMFIHDNNDRIRLFKRWDRQHINENEATCKEMNDVNVCKLEINVVKCCLSRDDEQAECETTQSLFGHIARCISTRK